MKEWQDKYCYLVPERNFLYVSIPKVLSTSMLAALRQMCGLPASNVDPYIDENVSALSLSGRKIPLLKVVRKASLFKFAFVRNPWSRMAAAFADKFIRHSWAPLAERTISKLGDEDLSFRQFVEAHVAKEPKAFNSHWRPQYLFFEGIELDLIARFENVKEELAKIRERIGPFELPRWKVKPWAREPTGNKLSSIPTAELPKLRRKLNYADFYTPELADAVARIYARDIELFGYSYPY